MDICLLDLLEWLTGCSPANLRMVNYEWTVQESSSCVLSPQGQMSQLVFSMCWSLKKQALTAVKEWTLLAR